MQEFDGAAELDELVVLLCDLLGCPVVTIDELSAVGHERLLAAGFDGHDLDELAVLGAGGLENRVQ